MRSAERAAMTGQETTKGSELDFEAWTALSARLAKRPDRERAAILAEAAVEPEAWAYADERWMAALGADLEAGELDRPRRYGAAFAAEVERRRKEPPPPPVEVPLAVAPPPEPLAAPSPIVEVGVSIFMREFAPPATLPLPELESPPRPVLLETIGVVTSPADPSEVVPFSSTPSPEFAAYLASQPKADAALAPDQGSTVAVPASGPGFTAAAPAGGLPGPTMPFQGAQVQIGGFTAEQYASLTAELSVYPDRASLILQRYGLPGEAARKKLADAWGVRLMQDAELRTRWMQLCAAYREWLSKQKR
jgi:hypothetical protein